MKHYENKELPPCPDCGKGVACGQVLGQTECWCQKYSSRLPIPADPNARCYCEDCLRKHLAEWSDSVDEKTDRKLP